MGHPCCIQRGLARRLCILLACTDPLSALAPQTSIGRWAYASAPAAAAGATLRGARGWLSICEQGIGSPSSSCLRIFSALDGWEDVGDPVLLVDTSESSRHQMHFLTWRRHDKVGRCALCKYMMPFILEPAPPL